MAALDIIGSAYGTLKDAKRKKEAESRARIAQELEILQTEFDALVTRAKSEGASISAIAEAMGASRSLVYTIIERHKPIAEARAEGLFDPRSEILTWDAANEHFLFDVPGFDRVVMRTDGSVISGPLMEIGPWMQENLAFVQEFMAAHK